LIPLALQVAAGQRAHIQIYGTDYDTPDGTCIRDYIHINDLAAGHLLALEHLKNGAASDAFNLCNGKGFSVKEVIHAAERATGKSIKVVEAERRPGDPPILVGSSDKARKILNWQVDYPSLDEIIKTSWFWQNRQEAFHKKERIS
jgi:UDP-glucose 4-epimerase